MKKASYYQKKRSKRATSLDSLYRNKNTLEQTPENIEKWGKNPARYDLEGVDVGKRSVGVRKHTRLDDTVDVKKHNRNITVKPASSGSKMIPREKPKTSIKDIGRWKVNQDKPEIKQWLHKYGSSLWIEYSNNRNKYIVVANANNRSKELKLFDNENDAIKYAINIMKNDDGAIRFDYIFNNVPFYNILYKNNRGYSINMTDYLRRDTEGKDYDVIKKIKIGDWDGETLPSIQFKQEDLDKSYLELSKIKENLEKKISDKTKQEEENKKVKSFDEVRQLRTDKFLDKKIRWSEGVYSYKDFIDKFVKSINIALVPSVKWNRRKYNNMGFKEQQQYEKRLDTKVPEYRIYANDKSFYIVPKTVYDYAKSKGIKNMEESQ